MKTAIVTDSTAYIPLEVREKYNIYMIPLYVIFGDQSFKEEIDLSADEFFGLLKNNKELPTTSQPSTGDFVELYEKLAKEYDAVISIHLASGASGTYHGAVSAGDMVEDIEVFPFDSEIACMIQGFYVIEAAKKASAGESAQNIMDYLNKLKSTAKTYFMVADLAHLQRGGRLSTAQALIGGLLQVKPLLHVENSVIVPFEKIRTKKKAMNRIVDLLREAVKSGEPYQAAIIHANHEEEAIAWKNEIESQFPNVEFSIGYIGGVLGTHLGEGTLGLGWMRKFD